MLDHKLTLAKTHDHCASGQPRLTVVMIHGIAADSSSYGPALEYLEGVTGLQDVRFVTFDLLGTGESLKSKELKYDYHEQLEALRHSIKALDVATPLILVGHSMGTFIVTRYATEHPKDVEQLILLSPPVYTEVDLKSPMFESAMQEFEKAIGGKYGEGIEEGRCFQNELKYIVRNKHNYKRLAELTTPATLIYGDKDEIIASFNIPELLITNPKYLTAIKTEGKHGITQAKYVKMVPILEKALDGENKQNAE